jgi:hypothetical protein
VSNFIEKCVHSSSNNNCFDITLLHSWTRKHFISGILCCKKRFSG